MFDRRSRRTVRFALSFLGGMLFVLAGAGLAYAQPAEVLIVWTASDGEGLPGSRHIQATDGDRLTATIYLRAISQGIRSYHVSLIFDADLQDELDLVSATGLLPVGFDTPGVPNPESTTESGLGVAGSVVGFSASASGGLGPATQTFAIGEVVFDVVAAAKDDVDVVPDLDHAGSILLDNSNVDITAATVLRGAEVNSPVPAATHSMVLIEQTGNADDTNGIGRVNHLYSIARFEITNAQYATFLNATSPDGSNVANLYDSRMGSETRGGITRDLTRPIGSRYAVKPGMGDRPVVWVAWVDAGRYVNWLENGRQIGSASLLNGSYNMGASEPQFQSGSGYKIPDEDEWYKAAYHDSGATYFDYPTGSNSAPSTASCDVDGEITNSGTLANFNNGCDWNGENGNLTRVGAAGVESPKGTFDQGGNVEEWNENQIGSGNRLIRGGSWDDGSGELRGTGSDLGGKFTGTEERGFRVALRGGTSTDLDDDGIPDDGSSGLGQACADGQTVGCDDNCPFVPNPSQDNYDGDGAGDACDNCTYHANTDGISPFTRFTPNDPRPLMSQIDTDLDGIGDACDRDLDGDGVDNENDSDSDGDTVPDDAGGGALPCDRDDQNCNDNCPFVPNWDGFPGQLDCDLDGVGDLCDCSVGQDNGPDSDGDGLGDTCDICPFNPDPDQADSDGDGAGNACDVCPELDQTLQTDTDGDGIGDACDVCPALASFDQTDTDADGVGDACDLGADSDGDGADDAADNCPHIANPGQVDSDSDGFGDECDPVLLSAGPFTETGLPVDSCGISRTGEPMETSEIDTLDFRWVQDGNPDFGQCFYEAVEGSADAGTGTIDWSYIQVLPAVADCCIYLAAQNATDPNPLIGMVVVEVGGALIDETDTDGDVWFDACDVCPNDTNFDQADRDFDEVGDLCDNCPDHPNPDQADGDMDGIGDACVPEPSFGLGLGLGSVLIVGLRRRLRTQP